MCHSIDIAKIAEYDASPQTPHEAIKEMRIVLDLMNKIIRKKHSGKSKGDEACIG